METANAPKSIPWISHRNCLAILACVGIVVMTIQLGNTHLWDQDEGYYASAAAEMYARNDWITPTFNGKLFAHKPPMMFWGMMVGYQLFGVNELGSRTVSSLFGLGTILLTYLLAKKLFDTLTGLFAGLAIGSCMLFTMVSRSATSDAHLTFFTLLAITIWMHGYLNAVGNSRNEKLHAMPWRVWMLTNVVMGLAVLTKGPIGFLFPTAVIGLYLLTESNPIAANGEQQSKSLLQRALAYMYSYSPVPFLITVWKMRPITAALTVLAIAGPWYALVQWTTDGAFLSEFIGVHHLGRFAGAMDNHSGPAYYYAVTFLVGMYPWSAFAIPILLAWAGQSNNSLHTRSVRLISCWVLVYLVIFSMASTKLPNYVLPAFPALAIMVGRYFGLWVADRHQVSAFWLHAGWCLLIAVGLVIATGFPVAGLPLFSGATLLDRVQIEPAIQTRFMWLGVVGLPLVLFGIAGWWAIARERTGRAAAAFTVLAVSMMLLLCQFVAPELDRFQSLQRTAQTWDKTQLQSGSEVAVLDCFRPSLVFYFDRELRFCDSADQAIEIVRESPQSLLITTNERYEQLKQQLPSTTHIVERIAQFPTQEELVVLGNTSLKR